MNVTGIGPYIKKNGSFKLMIQGTGFVRGDTVKLDIKVGSITTSRTGSVLLPVTGGCIAKIDAHFASEKDEVYDEDLAEVTVTVTNAAGTRSDPVTEPGIQE